jgi:NADH:ubiquinone oxidoreductase subunit E
LDLVPPSAGKVVRKEGSGMSMTEVKQATGTIEKQDESNVVVKVDEVLSSFTGEKAELIPILQQVQQVFGYLPQEAMSRIAEFVDIPECTVFGVATFYAQFKFVPAGRNVIKVCRGTGCYVKGAPRILDEIEKLLGIRDGETTSDLQYTLETVACFGSCALAPVMVVNDRVYGRVTPDKVKEILGHKD